MQPTIINYVRGDKLVDIPFTIKDYSGSSVVNITGATLLFKAQHVDFPDIKFSGSMTIVSGAAGTCKYTTQATDFDVAGDYTCEIQITFPSTQIQTYPGIYVKCIPDLPA